MKLLIYKSGCFLLLHSISIFLDEFHKANGKFILVFWNWPVFDEIVMSIFHF